MFRRPPRSTRTDTLFPYTTLFRSLAAGRGSSEARGLIPPSGPVALARAWGDQSPHALFHAERRTIMSLKEFADTLPDYAKDIRLNISSLLNDPMLGDQRKYGLLLACAHGTGYQPIVQRSEAHTSELQSLMRTSYAGFCLNKKNIQQSH